MNKTLHYLFDPLCGWCYGAGPALMALADLPEIELRLLPSGQFSGTGARTMDPEFAAYAWSNDQRIERLTGQQFTAQYRSNVLANQRQMFDSGPATVALTAVALHAPERELDALKAIQHARYIDGLDVTRLDTLAQVLKNIGIDDAADRLIRADAELLDSSFSRVAQAQALSQQVGARGVPAFVLEQDGQRELLHSSAVFSNPQAFAEQLATA